MKRIIFLLLAILPAVLFAAWPEKALAQSDQEIVAARIGQLNQKIADEHPRLLLRPVDLPALREFLKALPAQTEGAALAKLALPPLNNRSLIPEPQAAKNGTPEGTKLWQAGYRAGNETSAWAQRYALAWLVTADPAYGREAARWLMHLASWKIDRETYRTNDELFIQSLRSMIFAYDWAYTALTPEERATIGKALIARLEVLAAQVQPKFSLTNATPPDNSLSHPMRFISTLGQGGLALYHETANAPGWLAWAYEYYQRQFPVWGGPAGGWAEGLAYWSSGITQHQRFLEGMALHGFNEPLQRPFWRNTPNFGIYGLMPYGGSSFGDLTNIIQPNGNIRLMMEKFASLNADPYPLAYSRGLQSKPPSSFSYYEYDGIDSILQRFRASQVKLPEVSLADLPQSRYFDDIGVVTMHSALGDPTRDIMFGFRASPQGSASHSFSDQNSFVLNAFGEPLAISSGYREYFGSPHHEGWSRQTKSKNAILFGGNGQRIKDASATGTITRYAEGKDFTFVTGNALAAYLPHATKALRHVFFVNRRYFVILDEAAAPEAIKFQWQLHARSEMALAPEHNEITQSQGNARLTVRFLQPAAGELEFRQTDAFTPAVIASYQAKMPNEWHVSAETKASAKQQEFLTLLYPWPAAENGTLPSSQRLAATKGYATRLSMQATNELVLMARENEKQVETDGYQLEGMAASVSTAAAESRVSLVETTRYLSAILSLQTSTPVSVNARMDAKGWVFDVATPGPTSLRLKPDFVPTNINGGKMERGEANFELAAGQHRIRLAR